MRRIPGILQAKPLPASSLSSTPSGHCPPLHSSPPPSLCLHCTPSHLPSLLSAEFCPRLFMTKSCWEPSTLPCYVILGKPLDLILNRITSVMPWLQSQVVTHVPLHEMKFLILLARCLFLFIYFLQMFLMWATFFKKFFFYWICYNIAFVLCFVFFGFEAS